MTNDRHVVIVGAGVIGGCCAYFLARRGASVTVLERDEVGKGASYGNAGTIAPGHGPINRPGRVKQAVKSLLDPLSPLYVAPRFDPSLMRWLWQFSRACTQSHLDYCMSALAPLGHETSRLFDQLVSEEDLDCGYRQTGYYEVYRSERALRAASEEAAAMRTHGYRPQTLSGEATREREAALKSDVLGSVFFPEAATVVPYRFVVELADRAQRYGAQFVSGSDVTSVDVGNGRIVAVQTARRERHQCDAVVLATGVYGSRLFERLGFQVPLQAAKGYHRDRDPADGATPSLGNTCMLGEKSVFCTPMGGFLRLAGTLEFSGINDHMRRPRLEQLTNAAKLYVDGLDDAEPISEWCGLRPCISDGLPVIGPVPGVEGLFLSTGHGMLGLTLGPVTGRMIAELLMEGKSELDAIPFRIDRF
ncbi:MAG: FAD-dependent oxidoreductase [Gemmatimonadales bacterium]